LKFVLMLVFVFGLLPAVASEPLAPPVSPEMPAAVPSFEPGLLFPDAPWDTNALADGLDTSPPPDGALTVAREVGPDSSVAVLTCNFYYNSNWYCRISRSTNSGKTYTPATIGNGYRVDDVVVSSGRDTVYHISIWNGSGHHLCLHRSFDAGATWGDSIRVDRGTSTFTDKPMAASRDSVVYCTYTDFTGSYHSIRMCRSTDYGVTWNSGDINITSPTGSGQGSCPAASPNGDVYCVWGQPASWVPT
jgi:hypothetical protein